MMMKMNKVSPRQVLIALAIATVIYFMFANNTKSMYLSLIHICRCRRAI